jgi:hypothetical protein
MIWDKYCLKEQPYVFRLNASAEENRTSHQEFLESEYEVKQVDFKSPYLFHRFSCQRGPGSLGKVLSVDTVKAASLLLEDKIKEQLFEFLENSLGDCVSIISGFLTRSNETSCHLRVLDVLMKRIGRSVSFSFENRYFNGINARVFIELGMLLGAGGLWVKDCPVYFGTPLYCIDGDSIQWCSDIIRQRRISAEDLDQVLRPRKDFLHHVFSDLKEAEATISGLEHVIQTRISKEITFHWQGIRRGNATNRQWELAQTLYILRMKEMSLKYKNVHCSKRKSIIQEAETLLLEARGLYDYYMRDHDVYILAQDHYTLKKVERVEKKIVKKTELVQPPSYFVEVHPEEEKQSEPVAKYKRWTINEDKFYQFCAEELEPEGLEERIPHLIESINHMKNSIGLRPRPFTPYKRTSIYTEAFLPKLEIRKKVPGFTVDNIWHNYELEEYVYEVFIKDFFENKLIPMLTPPKKLEVPDEYSKYFNMSDSEIMEALKKEKAEKREQLSNKQAKKIIASIKAAKRDRTKQEEAATPGQVKMVEVTPPAEFQIVEKIEERLIVEYKPIPGRLILSEEKHTDFVKHSYPPEPKIIVRNAKKYVANAAKNRIVNRVRARDMRRNSRSLQKKLHDMVASRLHRFYQKDRGILWNKRKESDRIYLKLYNELKQKRFGEANQLPFKEPDFNVYDFATINRSKQLILAGEIFWTRGKYTKSKEKMLKSFEERGIAHEFKGIRGLWNPTRERARAHRKYRGLTQNIGRLLSA